MPEAVTRSKNLYRHPRLRFVCQNAVETCLPKSDLATCFEVVEHLSEEDSALLVSRIHESVQTVGGMAIFSTPRALPDEDRSDYRRKHHAHEYAFDEFAVLLRRKFRKVSMFTQTDEIISVGNPRICWTFLGVCHV